MFLFLLIPWQAITKNFTFDDFHQKVVFIQYFYLHQQLMVLSVLFSIGLFFLAFWLLQNKWTDLNKNFM